MSAVLASTRRPHAVVRLVVLRVVGIAALAAAGLAVAAAPAVAAPAAPPCAGASTLHPTHLGRFAGMSRPYQDRATRRTSSPGCATAPSADIAAARSGDPAASGTTPPLLFGGGNVMSAPDNASQVTVTPIYWAPPGFSFSQAYRDGIQRFLDDVEHDHGLGTNVFATMTQYAGRNGRIANHLVAGAAILDTTAAVADSSGYCTLTPGPVYADHKPNTKCISDVQLISELHHVVTANGLPSDLSHVYVVMTPKGVQTCDAVDTCSVNPDPSRWAYCGYHSIDRSTVYAHLPYSADGQGISCGPTFLSPTGTTTNQTPNGNVDADAQISILSHEVAEAITDPDTSSGWIDSTGNENGDECSFVFGQLHGSDGAYYNQKINGHRYLTQEEWSNDDYALAGLGCVQQDPPAAPVITRVSPNSGPVAGGQLLTLSGADFAGTTKVSFGATPVTYLRVVSGTSLRVRTPAHAAGAVNVYVTNATGPSVKIATDVFSYRPVPTITSVSPNRGSHAGGQSVTITGTGFTATTRVSFGSTLARFTVLSSTGIRVTSPAHAAGPVNVYVTTSGGHNPPVTADHYTFV